VGDIVDITYYPYGNAKERQKSDGTWSFTCQHGESECTGNLIMACGINLNNSTDQWFPFINCIEDSNSEPDRVAQQCAKQAGLDYSAIDSCVQGSQGNKIMHSIAEATQNLQPPHQWTPWVVMNGKPLSSNQLDKELIDLVCNAYTGTPPAACNQYLKQRKKIQVCTN